MSHHGQECARVVYLCINFGAGYWQTLAATVGKQWRTIKIGAVRLKGLLRHCAIGKHLWFTLANVGEQLQTLGRSYKRWGATTNIGKHCGATGKLWGARLKLARYEKQ